MTNPIRTIPIRPDQKPAIKVAAPYPLLDPGDYTALCTEASFEWARQWGCWKARLVLEPQDYEGRAYTGRLCKFINLGKNQAEPYVGMRSYFRMLLVEVNGEQPIRSDLDDMSIFENCLYQITVETVVKNRKCELLAPEHHYSIVRNIHPCKLSRPFNPTNHENSENLKNLLTDQPSNLVNLPLGNARVAIKRHELENKFG